MFEADPVKKYLSCYKEFLVQADEIAIKVSKSSNSFYFVKSLCLTSVLIISIILESLLQMFSSKRES